VALIEIAIIPEFSWRDCAKSRKTSIRTAPQIRSEAETCWMPGNSSNHSKITFVNITHYFKYWNCCWMTTHLGVVWEILWCIRVLFHQVTSGHRTSPISTLGQSTWICGIWSDNRTYFASSTSVFPCQIIYSTLTFHSSINNTA